MTARQSLLLQGMHAFIVLGVLASVTVLGVQGTLTGESVIAVYAAAIGFAGASAGQIGTLAQAVNGKSVVTSQMLAEQGATNRTGLVAAAGGSAHTVTPIIPVDQEHAEH
ncbi:MAG TPA: hypothetical protein VNC18_17535 [Gemmatimonadaceae bacterium]|jgi:hypothetical protein|nr:hypothetical protein [Gemmatimonadaceae bacterium]